MGWLRERERGAGHQSISLSVVPGSVCECGAPIRARQTDGRSKVRSRSFFKSRASGVDNNEMGNKTDGLSAVQRSEWEGVRASPMEKGRHFMNDARRNGKVRFEGPLVKPAASLKNKEGRRPEREKEDDDMWISATTMKNEIHCAAAGEMKFVGSAKFFPPKKAEEASFPESVPFLY